jgi:putative OPT family oligopeptide transporter
MNNPIKPYISADKTIPEFTIRAIIIGSLLSILMGAANTYLGLYAGMTVSASIPAAVISMGILRGVLRSGNVLENNMVQTIASAGESLAAGVIFTVPALVISGVWGTFDYWTVTLITLFGGLLGILFMIPLRQTLIVEDQELIYPEGVACAEVLKAGDNANSKGMMAVFGGLMVGGLLKFFISGVSLFKYAVEWSYSLGRSTFYFGSDISAALVGVGAIVGLNIATLIFMGGALGWLVAIPIMSASTDMSLLHGHELLDSVWDLWSTKVRYMGVGAMVVAGLWSIINVRKGIVAGVKEAVFGMNQKERKTLKRTEKGLSRNWVLGLLIVVGIPLLFYCFAVTGNATGPALTSWVLIMVASFFLVAVATYIAGLVGSSNSPVSGMTIFALLLTSIVFVAFGFVGSSAIYTTLLIAGVVCCATCTSGDVAQDLKTGHLVGATPYKQQMGEIIGTIVPAFFYAPILVVLHQAYGIGTGEPGALRAPQATLFAKLTEGIFGDGTLPQDMLILGSLLAIAIIFADEILKSKKASFRMHAMPVAVGIYLPFSLSIPMVCGGILHYTLTRDSKKKTGHGVVLAASGLIAGEALMGIFLAIAIVIFQGSGSSMSLPIPVAIPDSLGTMLSIGALIGIIWFLKRVSKKA